MSQGSYNYNSPPPPTGAHVEVREECRRGCCIEAEWSGLFLTTTSNGGWELIREDGTRKRASPVDVVSVSRPDGSDEHAAEALKARVRELERRRAEVTESRARAFVSKNGEAVMSIHDLTSKLNRLELEYEAKSKELQKLREAIAREKENIRDHLGIRNGSSHSYDNDIEIGM